MHFQNTTPSFSHYRQILLKNKPQWGLPSAFIPTQFIPLVFELKKKNLGRAIDWLFNLQQSLFVQVFLYIPEPISLGWHLCDPLQALTKSNIWKWALTFISLISRAFLCHFWPPAASLYFRVYREGIPLQKLLWNCILWYILRSGFQEECHWGWFFFFFDVPPFHLISSEGVGGGRCPERKKQKHTLSW